MKIPETVKVAVHKQEEKNKSNEWYGRIRKMVAGEQAVGQFIEGLDERMAQLVSENSKEIKVLPVKDNADKWTGYFAIFNLAEIEGREYSNNITMKVPADKVKLFIGANRWHLIEWVRNSWLRRLHVSKIWVEGV